MALQPIRYTRAEVRLMVRIAAHGSGALQRLAQITDTAVPDLRLIAAGRRVPTIGVLRFFDLQPAGRGYVWQTW